MRFAGIQQPAKGDSIGYFYSTVSIGTDSLLLRIMRPFLSAIALAHGAKWDIARVVKAFDFGLRNTRQNTRDKVADPGQARKDRILAFALQQAAIAKTPEDHADTVRMMAVLSLSDEDVSKLHTDLFGQEQPDAVFVKTIGPTVDQVIEHLEKVVEELRRQKKAG